MNTERQNFLDYLHANGLRVTDERLALLDEIYRHHEHIDADTLLDAMRDRGLKTSRATVYRNLDLLVDSGLVQKSRLGTERYLYEHVHPGQRHDHLVCTECGRVVEFMSRAIRAMHEEICRAHGFATSGTTLQISARCESCVPEADPVDEPDERKNEN